MSSSSDDGSPRSSHAGSESSSNGPSGRCPARPLSAFVPRLLLRLLPPPPPAASKPVTVHRRSSLEVHSLPRPSIPSARRLSSLPAASASAVVDGPQPEPALLTLPCALLFIDVSGFTSMMESAVQAASHGLEEVTGVISAAFSAVMGCVERFDGDLLKVAGDALLVAFYDLSHREQPHSDYGGTDEEVLPTVSGRALDCAEELRLCCDGFAAGARVLRLHVAVTCGTTHFIALGGCVRSASSQPRSGLSSRRGSHCNLQSLCDTFEDGAALSFGEDPLSYRGELWEFLAVGPSFADLSDCVQASAAGNIVVSASALRYATTLRTYSTAAIPNSEHRRLLASSTTVWPTLKDPLTKADFSASLVLPQWGSQSLAWLAPCDFLMPALADRAHLIASREHGAVGGLPVSAFAPAGTPGWLAEYRRVTVAFIRLPTVDWVTEDSTPCPKPLWLSSLQSLFAHVQRAVFATGGQIRQLMADEKGFVCIAVYGLSPFCTEHHAVRAVTFALSLTEELSRPGESPEVCVGVTTGRAYCGCVGSPQRMEYTLYGAIVNLSARLMEAAWKAGARVLCDDDTRKDCSARIRWAELPLTIAVKGKQQPCVVHEPMEVAPVEHQRRLSQLSSPKASPRFHSDTAGEVQTTVKQEPSSSLTPTSTPSSPALSIQDAVRASEVVELCAERGTVYDRIVALLSDADHRSTPIIVVEGAPGIGKSHLLQRLLAACDSMHLTALTGAADSMETATPYFAFLPIMHSIFAQHQLLQDASATEGSWLAALLRPSERPFIPLLADVLPSLQPLLLQLCPPGNDAVVKVEEAALRPQLILQMLTSLTTQVRRVVPQAVLIIEDAHWMDADSWALLRALVACPDVPVVLTARPLTLAGDTDTVSSSMEVSAVESASVVLTSPRTRLMRLTDLNWSDGLALAAHELGCQALSKALQALIMQQADGIPLFIQQFCRYGRDQGLFVVDAQSGVADVSTALQGQSLAGGDAAGSLLPVSLEGLLASTLDRMDPTAQFVIKVASVMGRYFHSDLLVRVQAQEAPLLTLSEMLLLLGHAQQNGVIQPVRDNSGISPSTSPHGEVMDPVYRFSHQLLRDAAYNMLLYQQRRELHGRVALLLTQVAPTTTQAASIQVLAKHYWWGVCDSTDRVVADVDRAFLVNATAHLLQAAVAAVRSGATSTSTCHLVRALRCIFAMESGDAQRVWELRWLLSWMGSQLMMRVIALAAFDEECSSRTEYAHPPLSAPSPSAPLQAMLLLRPFSMRLLALLGDGAAVAAVGIDETEVYRWRFIGHVALAYVNTAERPESFYTACQAVCELAAAASGPDGELYRLEALLLRVQAASLTDGDRQRATLRELEDCALYRRLLTGEQRLTHVVIPHSLLARMPMEHALQQWRFGRFQDAVWTMERCTSLQRHCWGPPPVMHPASLLFAACFTVRTLLSFGRHPATLTALAAVLPRLPTENSADHRLAYIVRCLVQLVLKWWRLGSGLEVNAEDANAVLALVASIHAEGPKLGPSAIALMGGGVAGILDYELDVRLPLSCHVALVEMVALFPILDTSLLRAENLRRCARMHLRHVQEGVGDAQQHLARAETALAEAERLDSGAVTLELMRVTTHCELWLLQGKAAHAAQRLDAASARVHAGEEFSCIRHAQAMRARLQQHLHTDAPSVIASSHEVIAST